MGEVSGFVRFEQQEDAQKVLAAAELPRESGLVVKDCVVYVEVVTGTSFIHCPCVFLNLSLQMHMIECLGCNACLLMGVNL